jgi:hypothetical protein
MWFCSNCRNKMEDKFGHCWQCGAKRVIGTKAPGQTEATAVPTFASFEELAPVKPQPLIVRLITRRNPLQRPLILLVMLILFKFLASPFLGKYGLYIVIVVGVLGLIVILWGHFKRDPTEGVGVKLN